MSEYNIKSYIATYNGTEKEIIEYFNSKVKYDKWRRGMEEKALSEYYNAIIRANVE